MNAGKFVLISDMKKNTYICFSGSNWCHLHPSKTVHCIFSTDLESLRESFSFCLQFLAQRKHAIIFTG